MKFIWSTFSDKPQGCSIIKRGMLFNADQASGIFVFAGMNKTGKGKLNITPRIFDEHNYSRGFANDIQVQCVEQTSGNSRHFGAIWPSL